MKDIKKIVNEKLSSIHVVDSNLNSTEFNVDKIVDSVVKETDLHIIDAVEIASQVVRTLLKTNIKRLTAPMIREFVAISMLELGFEKERYMYTRLGLPYFEVKKIIDDKSFEQITINQVKKEYNEISKYIEKIE